MGSLDDLVSKLRLLGDEVEILSSNAAIVKNTTKGIVTGYKINKGNISKLEYTNIDKLENTNNYFVGELNNKFSLLDNNLDIKLIFSGERPKVLINNHFILMWRNSSRSMRLIGLDGLSISEELIWKLKVLTLGENKIAVSVISNSGIYIYIAIVNNNKTCVKKLFSLSINDEVYLGNDIMALNIANKQKIMLYDYNKKLVLSIPFGKVRSKNIDNATVLDRFGKEIYGFRCDNLIYY